MALYLLGGAGIYHRLIQLTTPSVGYASVCNPYWYVCYPTLVPVNRIIGDRSSNDFGINFGAGVDLRLEREVLHREPLSLRMGSEDPARGAPPNGETEYSTNAGYFPLTFGVRW